MSTSSAEYQKSRSSRSTSSASPPDSPPVLTPTHTYASANMSSSGGFTGVDPPQKESYHISETYPHIDDLPPLPPSTDPTPLVNSAPHFVARSSQSPRESPRGKEGAFTSSSSPHHAYPVRPRGEKDSLSTPPRGAGKEAPEFASPFRDANKHPLSNGHVRHPSVVAPASPKPFYDSVPYWLALYFCFNLGLTLFNKVVLVSFPFPYTLTGLHALSGCAGTYIALERGAFTPARLTQKENLILGGFSVLYTINIAVSNISLQLVTVPFHQVVRAATPLFTIFVTAAFLRQRFSLRKLVSLLPVVAGVGFATYGDYYFTAWGLVLTLLGTFLAALKTVVTNVIQTGGGGRLKLHPLDLLMRMSPLAFVQCVFYGWYTGELERVRRYGATQMTTGKAIALLVNGVIACGLNIVSFTANKKAGALTMTVSANCKQVLTIALAVILFDLHITITNGIGIFLTLCGGGLYAYVEYSEKRKRQMSLKAAEQQRS